MGLPTWYGNTVLYSMLPEILRNVKKYIEPVLPTWYGKTVIYSMLPELLRKAKEYIEPTKTTQKNSY